MEKHHANIANINLYAPLTQEEKKIHINILTN